MKPASTSIPLRFAKGANSRPPATAATAPASISHKTQCRLGDSPPVSGNGLSATSSSLGSTTSGGDPTLPTATVAGSVDSLPHTETPSGVIFTEVDEHRHPAAIFGGGQNDVRDAPPELRRKRDASRRRIGQSVVRYRFPAGIDYRDHVLADRQACSDATSSRRSMHRPQASCSRRCTRRSKRHRRPPRASNRPLRSCRPRPESTPHTRPRRHPDRVTGITPAGFTGAVTMIGAVARRDDRDFDLRAATDFVILRSSRPPAALDIRPSPPDSP